jgi:hypothetical protein
MIGGLTAVASTVEAVRLEDCELAQSIPLATHSPSHPQGSIRSLIRSLVARVVALVVAEVAVAKVVGSGDIPMQMRKASPRLQG